MFLLLYLGCIHVLIFYTHSINAKPILGAEFSSIPPSTRNIVPQAIGSWTVSTTTQNTSIPNFISLPTDRPAQIDNNGWPIEDCYIILFNYPIQTVDPLQFIPNVWGTYTVSVQAKITSILLPPTINATIGTIVFNSSTWTTTTTITLYPSNAGFGIGFSGTQRSSSAPVGSGFTNLIILQPETSTIPLVPPTSFYSSLLINAIQPFSFIRCMQYTYGWWVSNFINTTYPGFGTSIEWSDRTLFTDALWLPQYIRPKSVGAPWESVILLAQEANVSVWINIPVQASGINYSDNTSYIVQLAYLLRDGNIYTNNNGIPENLNIYIEHGNEVWLNGSSAAGGGPSETYLYNKAAAIAEVTSNPSSNLNIDGCNDPEKWAYRRHARRIAEIGQIFINIFNISTMNQRIRPVFGFVATFANELSSTLQWFETVYGKGSAANSFYAVAVNSYAIAGILPGTSEANIVNAVSAASNATALVRADAAIVAKIFNLPIVSYEGSLVAIPVLEDTQTTGDIIMANRGSLWGNAMVEEYNLWSSIEGLEYSFFALASTYGEDTPLQIFQWGLTEDIHNLTTNKYKAVQTIISE